MAGTDGAAPDETGTKESGGDSQMSEAAASALATFRAAFAEVQSLSVAEPEAGSEDKAEQAMAAAKAKLANAMRAATLAGVSEQALLEASAPPEEEEEAQEANEEAALKIGDRVEIFGLESETGKQLNGQAGYISGFLEDKGRFQVKLSPEKVVSVRPENLSRLPPAEGGGCADSQSQTKPEERALEVGDRVEVFGLESEGGRKLNGTVGKTIEFVSDKGRWKIEMEETKEVVSVRPANLQFVEKADDDSSSSSSSEHKKKKRKKERTHNPEEALEAMLKGEKVKSDKNKKSARDAGAAAAAAAAAACAAAAAAAVAENAPLKLGDRVEVFGLQSQTGKALNGKTGLITKWDQAKGRFQVELGMANLQSLKPDNLRRVGAANANMTQSEGSGVHDSYSGSTAGYTLL
eukprot:TRINITY_DN27532_c0_g1_i1.p1 TRINITY_DN27532_c0_g1~~TRINITY_DN27532_c0_g1_i1.p1  ORF type:complete len:407 (+),score=130.09 TRINITY_DN27532_c0_g1_i1:18-1238(+)